MRREIADKVKRILSSPATYKKLLAVEGSEAEDVFTLLQYVGFLLSSISQGRLTGDYQTLEVDSLDLTLRRASLVAMQRLCQKSGVFLFLAAIRFVRSLRIAFEGSHGANLLEKL